MDMNHEIDEANRLAEVTKKMMQAAKAAQRNSKRCKQRLVRKAGKLSASDLERIATLKRCGLFVPESSDTSTVASSSEVASSSSSAASPVLPARRATDKLRSALGQVEGAADLLSAMQSHLPAAATSVSRPSSAGEGATSGVPALPGVPRGRRLSPMARVSSSAALPAASPGEDHDSHLADAEGETSDPN